MKNVYRLLAAGLFVAAAALGARAQGPRVATTASDAKPGSAASMPKPPAPPQTFKAKYEGGIFGYQKKQTGTLSFDDANKRLVFRDKEQREYISIPYSAVNGAFAMSRSQTTTGGTVVTAMPLPYGANLLGLLSRKTLRYMVLQFSDTDTRMAGVTSFKLENKDLLASVIYALSEKAGLEPRGDGYIRKKEMVAAPEM